MPYSRTGFQDSQTTPYNPEQVRTTPYKLTQPRTTPYNFSQLLTQHDSHASDSRQHQIDPVYRNTTAPAYYYRPGTWSYAQFLAQFQRNTSCGSRLYGGGVKGRQQEPALHHHYQSAAPGAFQGE